MGSDLLTISEAAGMLRLKPSTMRAWILRRKLPYCKVGRLVRIRRADVEAMIVASVVPARAAFEASKREQPTGAAR